MRVSPARGLEPAITSDTRSEGKNVSVPTRIFSLSTNLCHRHSVSCLYFGSYRRGKIASKSLVDRSKQGWLPHKTLCPAILPADDIVPFDHRRHTHPRGEWQGIAFCGAAN